MGQEDGEGDWTISIAGAATSRVGGGGRRVNKQYTRTGRL